MLCLITIATLIFAGLYAVEYAFERPRANAAHNRY